MFKLRARRVKNPALDLVVTIVVALGLAFTIQLLVLKPYLIPSESMLPTLEIGERVLVDRISGRTSDPKLGQVMVFYPALAADTEQCPDHRQGSGTTTPCATPDTQRSSTPYVKRVVGLPGDRISVIDGHVIRNGKPIDEPYALDCGHDLCEMPTPITVPAGHFYLMGDNRGNSADSRVWGPVARNWIVGPARFTYWPLRRIRVL